MMEVEVGIPVYNQGQRAYWNGVHKCECPYEHGTQAEFRVWNMGWNFAKWVSTQGGTQE